MAKTATTKVEEVLTEDEKILEIVKKTLDDNKAEDIEVIDLRGKTSITNFMVIASGTSQRHVSSLADYVYEALKKSGFKSEVEGKANADWVLLDAFDVIVHIFKPEVREFYNLEKMWKALLTAKPSEAKK
ncbi:MAG: ribosome silencing factor [Alphaproteobacteria bacterium]|nr:ribosome silencing factor [Alphaproteobacteria bacterium]